MRGDWLSNFHLVERNLPKHPLGFVFNTFMKLSSLIKPLAIKAKVKTILLGKLHAKPEITSRIATRIVREGVPRSFSWTYGAERAATLDYLESLRCGDYSYKFARGSSGPTLYGSCYACMLLGMYGQLQEMSESYKKGWLDYFDAHQDESDGFFRDPVLAGPVFEGHGGWGDGWGARHMAAHLAIGYCRLGRAPKYPFRFLEPYYDTANLTAWLASFDFDDDVWSQSNYIMNVYSLLQYSRDHMGEERADAAIEHISSWLIAKQRNDTGMWHGYPISDYPELGDAIRGAYHFFPLFVYEGRPIKYAEEVVSTILRSQNSWGGFNPEEIPSGACEDIDAIEPLIRACLQSGFRKDDVEISLRRALVWILTCRNHAGGYESIPENECPYGGHPLTTSRPGEGNLFATWFRTLCLAYIVDFLEIPHGFQLGVYPGYEINLKHGATRS